MKHKIFAFVMLLAFVLSAVALAFAADTNGGKDAKAKSLIAVLPASDAALAFDARRFFNEALPQVLAGNPTMLSEINGKVDQIKTRTGIDLRQFQQVVVGANIGRAAGGAVDVEPLILARGQYNADGLVAVAKLASNGKYREEKIGDKTVYVFSAEEVIEQNRGRLGNSMLVKIFDKMLSGLNREMALTSYDAGTLAIGSVARVREMFDAKTVRLNGEVLNSIARRPNSVVSFAAKVPNGLAQFIELDNDELGKNLGSIRLIAGALDIAGGSAAFSMSAKTVDAVEAKNLKDLLDGFKSLGSVFLGSAKGEDKKVYARMVEAARIAQAGNEVTLDVQVPQTDINILIGKKQ